MKIARPAIGRLRVQTATRLLTMAALLIPLIPLRGLVVPADHIGYLEFIQEAGSLSDTDLSAKQYVGIFYHFIGMVMPVTLFTNVVFLIYIYFATLAIRTISAYGIALVVSLPMFIHFNYVSKEGILGFLAVLGVLATLAFGKRIGQVVLVGGVIIFAVFVRPYYVLPITATALVLWLGMKRGLLVVAVGLIVVLIVFPYPFEVLESSRRQMYLASVYKFGTRTVYPNIWIDTHAPLQLQSIANYLVVLVETLVPISWTSSLKDLFAQIFMIAVLVMMVSSRRSSDQLFTNFGIFLILTVPFFSPDLGTSMRHIAAAALYIHMGIALQRIYEGGRLGFRPQQVWPIYPFAGGRLVR